LNEAAKQGISVSALVFRLLKEQLKLLGHPMVETK